MLSTLPQRPRPVDTLRRAIHRSSATRSTVSRVIACMLACASFTQSSTPAFAQQTAGKVTTVERKVVEDASESTPAFPELYDSEPETEGLLSPEEAVKSLRLPDGFSARLFAGEPEVQNPIAACTDPAGRVWVAENFTYAERSQRFDLSLNDRVLVLEDTDGDGVADRSTVFTDQVKMLTGITVGHGGVWLMCPPQLLFVPDADGDLEPDGPPEIVLDGFHVARENYHNFANGLSWGPDGWLYGRCGASCPGEVGLPGTIEEHRVPLRGGMWRYHPEHETFEALVQGTTNPWGHDWNPEGDLFFINTVNGHFWHAIPGAHFVRSHTIDANPYSYQAIDTHADHWHFDTGESWTQSRDGAANEYGGGHAHIGMVIYQGQRWPEKYRGRPMTVNMHGRRINTERLDRQGSGYVARHAEDLLLSDDTWFRGMELIPTPDDNLLILDWSDTAECHDHSGVHRSSGRIYSIRFTGKSGASEDAVYAGALALLAGPLPNDSRLENRSEWLRQLVGLQIHGTEWQARRAREVLKREQLRGKAEEDAVWTPAIERLRACVPNQERQLSHPWVPAHVARLRALWTLHSLDQLTQSELLALLDDDQPAIRGWAIRLLSDRWPIDQADGQRPQRAAASSELPDEQIVSRLVSMAADDPDASVRLVLASTLQRLPHAKRASLAKPLMQHRGDADDHNLPLLVWYGLTPLGDSRQEDLVSMLEYCSWPTTRELIARRVADKIESQPRWTNDILNQVLERVDSKDTVAKRDEAFAHDVILGISKALAGRQRVDAPENWQQVNDSLAKLKQDDEELERSIQKLNVLFGNGVAIDELFRLASDGGQALEARKMALQSLVDARAEGTRELCLKLLSNRFLNIVAAEGLARQQAPEIGERLIERFRSFAPLDRPRVISILTTRRAWAEALLQAVEDQQIAAHEIDPYQARQIANHADDQLTERLSGVWGQVRQSPAERRERISDLKEKLTPEVLDEADLSAGRKIFAESCASCHRLFGRGGELGPDLTGAQRGNLGYLLDNIVDPSAVVDKDFRATVVLLADGRVLTGLKTRESDREIELATQEAAHSIPREEIDQMQLSTASTMPDGLLKPLSPKQIRDLFGYLQSTRQVPLPGDSQPVPVESGE